MCVCGGGGENIIYNVWNTLDFGCASVIFLLFSEFEGFAKRKFSNPQGSQELPCNSHVHTKNVYIADFF